MEQSARPGDMLADRYLLVDLLTESGGGRFWRAEDRVLDRHVALHCIPADDPRATRLTEAARLSATVLDRHILRVLDADQQNGLAYVVNEWGSGSSLDNLVGGDGPLPPRRAAWIVAEVSASMAVAHEHRVPHGRLVPENVLIDQSGSVRLIGFCVDAALHGMSQGDLSTDVTDLGGLLYFALTGRWAGSSPSAVPEAMREGQKWLRPRQARAGIPRTLDALCDQVLNPFDARPAHSSHNLRTARGISEELREYVGDPSGLIEPVPLGGVHGAGALAVPERHHPGPDQPEQDVHGPDVHGPDDPGADRAEEPEPTLVVPTVPPEAGGTEPVASPDPGPDTGPVTASGRPTEQPTQAGMPIFDEENDDVSWLERRSEPPPPPPEFEEPPERPLFAPEPADGGPARRPRPGTANETGGFWPWDTAGAGTGSGVIPVTEDVDEGEVPGRSWFRLAVLISVSLLLLVAMVVAYNLGRGKTPLGSEPEPEPPNSESPTEASLTAIEAVSASDLDPQADPPEENSDLAPLAIDGDPETGWRTSTYNDQLGPPPGLKTGVGLYVDLGEAREVRQIDLTLGGTPTNVTYFVSDEEPTAVAGLERIAREKVGESPVRTSFEEPVTARYLVVWLTELPAVDGGFRGDIRELVASE